MRSERNAQQSSDAAVDQRDVERILRERHVPKDRCTRGHHDLGGRQIRVSSVSLQDLEMRRILEGEQVQLVPMHGDVGDLIGKNLRPCATRGARRSNRAGAMKYILVRQCAVDYPAAGKETGARGRIGDLGPGIDDAIDETTP